MFSHNRRKTEPEMATRAVAFAQQSRGEGARKMNSGQGQGKRRVLGDIGNLQNHKTRPISRDYCGQLLAKTQALKPQKVIDISSDEEDDTEEEMCMAARKLEVIEISSDEEDKAEAARKSRVIGSGKDNKTLTSVLTARSKAACRLTTYNKLKDAIADIDAIDAGNDLAVVEYVDDIYKFYKQVEDEGRIGDYMESQPEINAKMRSILMDWLVQLHTKFELMPETLYLTINIVDRFLSMKILSRRELQLVGISAMLVASKYEEIWAPEVTDLIAISDKAYGREQVLAMEKAILGKLGWYLTVPTPYVFLVRYIKASVPFDKEVEKMAFFVAELGLVNYPTVILFCPSMLAAAAVYTALCVLNKSPSWSETLKHYTGYSEHQLKDCAKILVGLHSEAAGSNLKAVYMKFSQ